MGPNCNVPVLPKDEGHGLMITAFLSRKFGFNWQMTCSQLDLVNEFREKKTYIDENAAIVKRVKIQKDKLTYSPVQQR